MGDAIADNITTTTSISVGGTLNSLIDHSGDLDFISVQLVAGQSYTFSLDGGTLFDSYLELRDSTGALIATNDDGGIFLDSFLMYNSAAYTGTYYIVARGFDGGSTGTYSLTADDIATGQTSPTTFTPNSLPFFSWEEAAIQISRNGAGWMSSFGTGAVVTYAYRSTAPGAMPDDTAGFSVFSAAQIVATELALAAWASVANITFVRVNDGAGYSNNATILFSNYSSGAEGAAAFAYLPSSGDTAASSVQGDVWVNISQGENQNPLIGTYGFQTILHEIGHALGLSHPGDYNAGGGGGPITYPDSADFYGDTRMFTIMSYFASSLTGGHYSSYASLPAVFDIAAIQRLYGANTNTRTGDTTYGFNSNTGITEYSLTFSTSQAVFTVWDGGGNDTLDFSLYSEVGTIDLREESFSSVGPRTGGTQLAHFNVSIAHGVVIENAIGGSGNDTIIGNSANNFIDGRGGGDNMQGGLGDDTYVVNHFGDTVVEGASAGTDTVQASLSYTLMANVENLTLTGLNAINGTGNTLNNIITGNDQINTLSGGDGNDTLNGAGGADILQGGIGNDTLDGGLGADQMYGGLGDDTFYVDNNLDFVSENVGEGTDTIVSTLTRQLAANVENLTLAGSSAINGLGNSLNNVITGNSAVNWLYGYDGNDTLDGGGEADKMFGGAGDDTYYVDNNLDFIVENVGEGTDTVVSTLSRQLVANFENLTLAGSSAINGFGNSLNNVITGNSAVNWLYGYDGNDTLDGGGDADKMFGGAGDDTYYIDNNLDFIVENVGEGTDTVVSTLTRQLVANFENLTLAGSSAINGLGNSANNVITGNSAVNWLYGYDGNDTLDGGGGADKMFGGAGDDTYIIDNNLDFIVENANEGTDTVVSTLTRQLVANFENLVLAGSNAINGLGNSLNNVITGNSAVNWLYGYDGNDTLDGGGAADKMFGGAGDDTYIIDNNLDFISENANEGIDTVMSSLTRALGANFENLVLTGSANINGIGNSLDNHITGNAGANTLIGDAGADTFVFAAPLGAGNVDAISDFNVADDTIELDISIFTAIAEGALSADAFAVGAAATTAEHRILYDPTTGALYYDADGNGAGAAIQFATLSAGLSLTHDDFFGGP